MPTTVGGDSVPKMVYRFAVTAFNKCDEKRMFHVKQFRNYGKVLGFYMPITNFCVPLVAFALITKNCGREQR